MLPGYLRKNTSGKFDSLNIDCVLDSNFFNIENKKINIPIANSFGNYSVNYEVYIKMEQNDQIFLKYDSYTNGSFSKIAGICNKTHTVFGLMPHPERIQNKKDRLFFKDLFMDILQYKKQYRAKNIRKKIIEIMDSEHVSYKSTKKFLSNLYTKSNHVIQGPGENAGIIDIGNGYCIASRIESHNHPIFIDPFQGAATGVGGIVRDIFTWELDPLLRQIFYDWYR